MLFWIRSVLFYSENCMEMLNKSLIGILQVEEINQQKNIKIDEANSASKYFPHFQEA